MIVYSYNREGEFVIAVQLNGSDRDPMQPEEYIIPGNCTTIAPPDIQAGFARVFSSGAWGYIEDHRDEVWYDAQGNQMSLQLGAVPVGLTQTKPSAPLWAALRSRRDAKLTACDWTQLPDAPLTTAEKAEWAAYRQALRDLPENTVNPENPVWLIETTK